MSVALVYQVVGLQDLIHRLTQTKKTLDTDERPFKRCAAIVTASVLQNFRQGGRPEKWEDLSPLSYFVRSHRSGKTNRRPVVLRDTGRLMNSIVPHFASNEKMASFGAKTNVTYARLMDKGGTSTASSVVIAAFKRKTPSGGETRVRSYTMNIKGGHRVPARPFMLLQKEDLTRIQQVIFEWLRGKFNG